MKIGTYKHGRIAKQPIEHTPLCLKLDANPQSSPEGSSGRICLLERLEWWAMTCVDHKVQVHCGLDHKSHHQWRTTAHGLAP